MSNPSRPLGDGQGERGHSQERRPGKNRSPNPLPYAAVPHELADDPRLNPTVEPSTARALLSFAFNDYSTSISNKTLAKKMRVSEPTAKRSLYRLEKAGWVRLRYSPQTPDNPAGRSIVLCWRLPDFLEGRKAAQERICREPISVDHRSPVIRGSDHERSGGQITGDLQLRIVVVEPEENQTPRPPNSDLPNDNDPQGEPPASLAISADNPTRHIAPDLGAKLTECVDALNMRDPDQAPARSHVPTFRFPTHAPAAEPKPAAPAAAAARPECDAEWLVANAAKVEELLSTFTTDQRARFGFATPEKQAMLISMLAMGMVNIAIAELPRPRVDAPPEPKTTAEMITTLAVPGAPHSLVHPTIAAVALDFGSTEKDRKLWRAFEQLFSAVWQNRFPAEAVLDAYRQAMNPKSKNKGAVFNTALRRDHGWDPKQGREG